MANPAQLLHNRFLTWRGSHTTSAIQARGLNGANWDEHKLAVRHLDEIEELIRLLEGQGRVMRVQRATLPSWHQTVFAYSGGWNGNGTALIDKTSLNTLEAFAERLIDVVPEVEVDGLDKIGGYLDSVREVLVADASLPTDLRSHINDVITHVQWCVDNYATVGDFSLQDALERLSGAIVRGAANSSDRSKWQNVMSTFVWPFAVNMIAALPSAGLVALVAG